VILGELLADKGARGTASLAPGERNRHFGRHGCNAEFQECRQFDAMGELVKAVLRDHDNHGLNQATDKGSHSCGLECA
jgi:hypothetical protein